MMKKAKGTASIPQAEGKMAFVEKVKPDASASTDPNTTGSGTSTPRKLSAASSDKSSASSKSLTTGKNYLSKSQDNLAAKLRRKASEKKQANNKENISFKMPSTPKSKQHKTPSKRSNQEVDETGTPIKRTQSAQNITKPQPTQSKNECVKRASSTQNISQDKGATKVRMSSSANIMAYNSELLANFEKEKRTYEKRISELIQVTESRKTEIEKLKFEVKNLKECDTTEQKMEEIEVLRNYNKTLKDKLNELGVTSEHVTNLEKLTLVKKPSPSDSVEGAVCGGSMDPSSDSLKGLSLGEVSCMTPEHPSSLSLDNCNWDKQSNKSSDAMSEISVACLQERIYQMEETHYSTNEELQATLQELGDLQSAVNELSDDNERLSDERQVLLESLAAQTEKLQNCRMQIEHLKALLLSDSEGADRSENEKQLVALLKSAQLEKEELLLKLKEVGNSIFSLEKEYFEQQDIVTALKDKIHLLEMKNESIVADKKALEVSMAEYKELQDKDKIELQRVQTLLENERTKVSELEQFQKATDKTAIEELLDNTRQDKEKLESRLADTKQELAVSKQHETRLQEQLSSLTEEIKVLKNNTKKEVSDLEYRMEKMNCEKSELEVEIDTLRDHIDQLQLDCNRYLEEGKAKGIEMDSLQNELRSYKVKSVEVESELFEYRQKYNDEKDEWNQFQSDLQTAVVIANEIKAETQEDMERLQAENGLLKDSNQQLQDELANLQETVNQLQQQHELRSRNEIRGRVMTTVDRELNTIRQGRKLSDTKGKQNQSVKNLIQSIENSVKQPSIPTTPEISSQTSSRRNSVDSICSVKSTDQSPNKSGFIDRRVSMPSDSPLKSVLRKSASSPAGASTPENKEARTPLSHRHNISNIIYDQSLPVTEDSMNSISPTANNRVEPESALTPPNGGKKGILREKSSGRKISTNADPNKEELGMHSHGMIQGLKSDPLSHLTKIMGGSKRNALLKWCQQKTAMYSEIDITNFSSSWNDGLAFCAILHGYLPKQIPYKELNSQDKRRNFTLAFKAAESVGIPSILNTNDMVAMERPDWQAVMSYVTSIYKHFEILSN